MSNVEILIAVIQQLRGIFLEKGELKGYDDWDSFFGCITMIENVIKSLQQEEPSKEDPLEENEVKE